MCPDPPALKGLAQVDDVEPASHRIAYPVWLSALKLALPALVHLDSTGIEDVPRRLLTLGGDCCGQRRGFDVVGGDRSLGVDECDASLLRHRRLKLRR